MTRIKRLIGGFSFGWFLTVMLKCISFCDRRAKEFKVSKYFVNIFVLFLIEKCVIQSILVEANLCLAIKLQPELIIRAILQVISILRKKIKVVIELKFYLRDKRILERQIQTPTNLNKMHFGFMPPKKKQWMRYSL